MFAPFKLRSTLARNASANLDDSLRTKKALKQIGYFETPEYGLTEYPDEPLFKGIENFQRDHGLRRDGVMKPEGETATALGKTLGELTSQETVSKPNTERNDRNQIVAASEPKPTSPPALVKRQGQVTSKPPASANAGSDSEIAFAPAVPFAIWLMPILGAVTAAAAMAIYNKLSKVRRGELRRQYEREKEQDDFCQQRRTRENSRCRRWGLKWRIGCEDRARDRFVLCRNNGGKPDPNEPPEWSRADMEVSPPR